MIEKNEKVDFKIFILFVSIAGAILGFLWQTVNKTNDKVDLVKDDVSQVKQDVSYIRAKIESKPISQSGEIDLSDYISSMVSHK